MTRKLCLRGNRIEINRCQSYQIFVIMKSEVFLSKRQQLKQVNLIAAILKHKKNCLFVTAVKFTSMLPTPKAEGLIIFSFLSSTLIVH